MILSALWCSQVETAELEELVRIVQFITWQFTWKMHHRQDRRNFSSTCALFVVSLNLQLCALVTWKMHLFSANQMHLIFSCTLLVIKTPLPDEIWWSWNLSIKHWQIDMTSGIQISSTCFVISKQINNINALGLMLFSLV